MRPFRATRVARQSRLDSRIGGLLLLMLLVMALQAVTVPPDGPDGVAVSLDGMDVQSLDALPTSPDADLVAPLLAQVNKIGTTVITDADQLLALRKPFEDLPPD